MFSFDTKRDTESASDFDALEPRKKGLLAPFNPKGVGCTGKN